MDVANNDIIIAPITAAGASAVTVFRLSGAGSIACCARCLRLAGKKRLEECPSHSVHFGQLLLDKTVLDEVLVTLFHAPRSYTGEEVVELSCHGSPYLRQEVLALFLAQGVRMAAPGEFTQRAFLNGKLDLAQAEAVADVIASESQAAHRVALHQMRGGVSKEMEALRAQLIEFTALLELELDFSEEEVEFADRTAFQDLLAAIRKKLLELSASFSYGNVLKTGIPVAIAGKPNAGKSSLLNALLKEDKALVSNIPGTTRDTIEDSLTMEGILFRFMDTAGLRETEDVVETMGIAKAREQIQKATILLYLFDRTAVRPNEVAIDVHSLYREGMTVFLVESKADLLENPDPDFHAALVHELKGLVTEVHLVSVVQPTTLKTLQQTLVALAKAGIDENALVITNARHYEALQKALVAVDAVANDMESGLSGDLLSVDLKEALLHMGTITGKIDMDKDVLGTIFGLFCIGK